MNGKPQILAIPLLYPRYLQHQRDILEVDICVLEWKTTTQL